MRWVLALICVSITLIVLGIGWGSKIFQIAGLLGIVAIIFYLVNMKE